jgi:hypothetical protein
MYSLSYERQKIYPIPFVMIPEPATSFPPKCSYERATVLSELSSKNILPENHFNPLRLKDEEKQNILNYCCAGFEEFNGFKKGLIWRTLEKYRRLKKYLKEKKAHSSSSLSIFDLRISPFYKLRDFELVYNSPLEGSKNPRIVGIRDSIII